MTVGKDWLRRFIVTVLLGWVVLAAAGVYLARLKGIPSAIAVPIVAAFLLEYACYLVPGFAGLREWLSRRIPPRPLALAIAVSAVTPYLIYSVATGEFRRIAAARLVILVLVISFWYIFRRPSPAGDLALLGLISAALVTRFFRQIYLSPIPDDLSILGKLMLFRLVPTVMLVLRDIEDVGFGFLPTAKEWKTGAKYFLLFLPIGLALSAALKLFHFKTGWTELAVAPFVFLGVFLAVALPEEFLARGLLQQWFSDWTGRSNLALVLASCFFGLAHLWFRPPYPNWKMAIIVAVAGWFYGKAYLDGGGVRASAVTHALVVTAWRTLS